MEYIVFEIKLNRRRLELWNALTLHHQNLNKHSVALFVGCQTIISLVNIFSLSVLNLDITFLSPMGVRELRYSDVLTSFSCKKFKETLEQYLSAQLN